MASNCKATDTQNVFKDASAELFLLNNIFIEGGEISFHMLVTQAVRGGTSHQCALVQKWHFILARSQFEQRGVN